MLIRNIRELEKLHTVNGELMIEPFYKLFSNNIDLNLSKLILTGICKDIHPDRQKESKLLQMLPAEMLNMILKHVNLQDIKPKPSEQPVVSSKQDVADSVLVDTLKVCNGEGVANSIANIDIGNATTRSSENLENLGKPDFENMDVDVSVLADTLTESHISLLGQEDHLPS